MNAEFNFKVKERDGFQMIGCRVLNQRVVGFEPGRESVANPIMRPVLTLPG